jgi:DTW domain-containing protein YfiP
MRTRTRFAILMHPREWKREKAATGRLTHLCLADSEIHVGIGFDEHAGVQALLRDPTLHPVLLYPGPGALDLSAGALPPAALGGRRLAVIALDATWSLGRKMLRLSPSLQRLPRVMFATPAPSRYVIKQQPHPACLSTLEAVHELLLVLERAGLDAYPDPAQLPDLFRRMQEVQLRCAADPARAGYRRKPYSDPATRVLRGGSGSRKGFDAPRALTPR